MATCGSLRHIFENTIPENNSSTSSSLIDSLSSWKHIRTLKPPLDHSFTEIFGELHFKETHPNQTTSPSSFFPPPSSSSSSSSSFFVPPSSSSSASAAASFPVINSVSQWSDNENQQDEKTSDGYLQPYHCKSESFSSLNSDSLQLCTEGLGSESLDDTEDLKMEAQNNGCSNNNSHHNLGEKLHVRRHSDDSYCRKIRLNGRTIFPPPIPYIGQTGKPSVSFESYRKNGRFVLKEVRTPTHECLQASREDGRLRLTFIQPNDEDDDVDNNVVEEDDNDENTVEDDDDDYDDDDDVEDDGNGEGGEGKFGGVIRIEEEEERGVEFKEEDEAKS